MSSILVVLGAAIVVCGSTPASADPGDVQLRIDNVGGYLRELDGLAETVDHPHAYRRCFRRDPGAAVTVTVNIRATGKPGVIAFDSAPSRRVKACIQRVVRGLRFLRQVHPRSVTFTLTAEAEPIGTNAAGSPGQP